MEDDDLDFDFEQDLQQQQAAAASAHAGPGAPVRTHAADLRLPWLDGRMSSTL